MSGLHLDGAAGPHEGLLSRWAANGLQAVTHAKPEPNDGARLRAILPRGFLVARSIEHADGPWQARYEANPQEAAQWLYNFTRAHADRYSAHYNALQINNEPGLGRGEERRYKIGRLVAFTRHALQLFNGWGRGVALFSFSRGNPEPDDWPALYEVWREALAANRTLPPGQQNVLSLHQYGSVAPHRGPGSLFADEAWHLKRFELTIRPTLPADLRAAPYIMTESGPDDDARGGWKRVYSEDVGTLADDWRRYNEWLARDERARGCLGACFFTLRQQGGFENFDIEGPAADTLSRLHYPALLPAGAPAPVPPPPPTPPTPPPPTGGAVPIHPDVQDPTFPDVFYRVKPAANKAGGYYRVKSFTVERSGQVIVIGRIEGGPSSHWHFLWPDGDVRSGHGQSCAMGPGAKFTTPDGGPHWIHFGDDPAKSESVHNLGLPVGEHTIFRAVGEWVTEAPPSPPPAPGPVPPTPTPVPGGVKWDKPRWAIERGAGILQAEGFTAEAAWLLNCDSYQLAKLREEAGE